MRQQAGVTLVELMISLVLSLSLVAGVGSLFLHMQKSNKIQRSMAIMADDSSYVQEVLQKEIRRTGGLRSRSDVNGTADRVFTGHNNVLNSGLNFATSEYIKGDATLPTNDAFIIRYQLLDIQDLSGTSTSNGSSPCTQNILLGTGEDPTSQQHVVSVYFYLHNDVLSCWAQRGMKDTASGIINEICIKNCASPLTTDFTPDTTDDTPVDLINNVAKLSLSYGVDDDNNDTDGIDSDGDGLDADVDDGAANYYTDAAAVPTNKWKDVISVRLSIVTRSGDDHITNSPLSYAVDGQTYTPTDNRLYKVFTTTIALRNQI